MRMMRIRFRQSLRNDFFSHYNEIFVVAMRLGDTPVPIPNTTVKT